MHHSLLTQIVLTDSYSLPPIEDVLSEGEVDVRKIKEIRIQNSKLKWFRVDPFRYLEQLYLPNNQISSIQHSGLELCKLLKHLDLSNNLLSSLSEFSILLYFFSFGFFPPSFFLSILLSPSPPPFSLSSLPPFSVCILLSFSLSFPSLPSSILSSFPFTLSSLPSLPSLYVSFLLFPFPSLPFPLLYLYPPFFFPFLPSLPPPLSLSSFLFLPPPPPYCSSHSSLSMFPLLCFPPNSPYSSPFPTFHLHLFSLFQSVSLYFLYCA